jgi:putative DeoR family transcriptional regulator (stage III sporulation protein D)
MKGYIEERSVELAKYFLERNMSIRRLAKKFGISPSTVNGDFNRLKEINAEVKPQNPSLEQK